MTQWTDLAPFVGPTKNRTAGAMGTVRGLVVHIASGFFEGTETWQKNPTSKVSSHFIVGRVEGQIVQMVDPGDEAWAQRAGNSNWLSIECEGFAAGDAQLKTHPGWDSLTDWQMRAVASVFARIHAAYDVPLQLAGTPAGTGLGYHSMGAEHGYDWGHLYCPGEPIKAQLPAILALAINPSSGGFMAGLSDLQQIQMFNRVEALLKGVDSQTRNGVGTNTVTETNGSVALLKTLVARPGVDVSQLAPLIVTAMKPLLVEGVTEDQIVAALASTAGQAALSLAAEVGANKAEDE